MKKLVKDFQIMKNEGKKITVLTAYDAPMARVLHDSEVDMLLVGDSLGMVVLGYDSTVPVTMEEMLHHAKAVRRGTPEAFVVCDMPFGSYQTGVRDAVLNALRLCKEAGADAVKLEGGVEISETIRAIVTAGMSVMGHIGLTPQTASQLGGFKVQGKDIQTASKILADARSVQEAGAFSVVLECVPSELGRLITSQLHISTIGIGAGPECDGQVLVVNDLLGLYDKFKPKFVKQYHSLAPLLKASVEEYVSEVRSGSFPSPEFSFTCATDYSKLLGD